MQSLPKSQFAFIVLFVTLNTVIPLLYIDLYPFTAFPMYSDAPTQLTRMTASDPVKNLLNPVEFSVHDLYIANRSPKIGRLMPETLNSQTLSLDQQMIEERLLATLKRHPALPYITISRQVFGPRFERETQSIGVIKSEQWRITNSQYGVNKKQADE